MSLSQITPSMSKQRLIDRDERTRKKPMRILVLGMCRTGTTTIAVALRKLGYTSHQMRDVLAKPSELALWEEAVNVTLVPPQERPSNQQKMEPYGKEEFDKLLADYDVVMDLPGCVFASELVKAYPEAKVILTKRRYEDWEQSMQDSIWCLDTWRLFTICRQLNITQLAPLMRLVHSIFQVHNGNQYGGPAAKSAFDQHYDTVRSLVPQSQLLELDTDGTLKWDPLCKFLGKAVPKEGFPKTSEDKAMRKGLEGAWWGMVQYFVMLILLPGLVVVGSAMLYTYADEVRSYRDGWLMVAKKYMETGEL
ncbi:uncharacterized protein J4E78_009935 [Alternaria triticimaculans]|uniref:uncharacterized protein n=1 Tax=Alternaria triticimaculans TaxID=297637 RepID=UPI0020C2AB0B|nr:uncharacterized protein J4E78_009935 [Alternaria triticimaculans]KAI4643465.1 hypothetical protein J4E78_009935 [Alternaria triticimaculans]